MPDTTIKLPMTRAQFITDYVSGMRNVVQKFERMLAARTAAQLYGAPEIQQGLANAMNDLESTLLETADHLYDAFGAR